MTPAETAIVRTVRTQIPVQPIVPPVATPSARRAKIKRTAPSTAVQNVEIASAKKVRAKTPWIASQIAGSAVMVSAANVKLRAKTAVPKIVIDAS